MATGVGNLSLHPTDELKLFNWMRYSRNGLLSAQAVNRNLKKTSITLEKIQSNHRKTVRIEISITNYSINRPNNQSIVRESIQISSSFIETRK